jgi:exonuclease III
MGSKNFLIWNVHDINARGHRDVVRNLVDVEKPSLVCVQETKCVVLNDFDVMQLLSLSFDYFSCLWLKRTRKGGIVVTWRSMCWSASSISTHMYLTSARMHNQVDGKEWWLTVVYGPFRDTDQPTFLDNLWELTPF